MAHALSRTFSLQTAPGRFERELLRLLLAVPAAAAAAKRCGLAGEGDPMALLGEAAAASVALVDVRRASSAIN